MDGLRCGSLLVVSHLFSDVGDIGHGDAGDTEHGDASDIGHGDASDIEHGDAGDGELVDEMVVYLLVAFIVIYSLHAIYLLHIPSLRARWNLLGMFILTPSWDNLQRTQTSS